MTFHRSFSAADLHRPRPVPHHPGQPDHPDAPAQSPTEAPHRRNLADAERRPLLRGLALRSFEPVHHAAHAAGRVFQAPPPVGGPVPPPSSVRRLPDRAGRPDPVFGSALYTAFLGELHRLLEQVRQAPDTGANASYIPELARCDPRLLQLSIATPSGALHSFGDDATFSIQSLAKMFILASTLRERGIAAVSGRVATLYSPLPFNGPCLAGLQSDPVRCRQALACQTPQASSELVRLARAAGDTRFANAACNLGAIGLTQLLPGSGAGSGVGRQARLMALVTALAPAGTARPEVVATAHAVHGSELRNTSGNEMRARVAAALLGDLLPPGAHLPLPAFRQLQAYIAACALEMDCSGLAAAFAGLAAGRNVFTGQPVLRPEEVGFLQAQMRVAGLYQASADFFLRTGLLAKSGVSGAVAATCPQTGLAFAVYSAPVDADGNSTRGLALLQAIARLPGFAALRRARREQADRPAALRERP